MDDQEEEGGTKLSRRPVQQIPQQSPQFQQSPQQSPQQMPQQYQQQRQQQIINNSVPASIKNGRLSFPFKDKGKMNNVIIVIVVFILLNSRIAWRAISRMPMMGSIEPSILALIVNGIIAGVAFYIISNYVNKS